MHLKIKINFLSFFKDDQGLLSYAKSNNLTEVVMFLENVEEYQVLIETIISLLL
jgi:hypothetical protein